MNDFFADVYSIFYSHMDPDLYDFGLYQSVGLVCFLLPLGAVIVWYYLMDSPKMVKFRHWATCGFIVALLIAILAIVLPVLEFKNQGIAPYPPADYISFVAWNFILAFLLFSIYSSLFKWWSVNQRRNPF